MTQGPPEPRPNRPDPLAAMVPTGNSPALISYYLGLFSIFPVLGLFLGGAALFLGVKGLQAFAQDPSVRGRTHAGVGIGCGLIGFLFNLAIVIGTVLLLLSPR